MGLILLNKIKVKSIKSKVKLDLVTDVDMLLIIAKGIRDGTCYAIHWYVKANNKCTKNYDKIKNLRIA